MLSAQLIRSNRAECDGLSVKARNPECAISRLLIEHGHDPETPIEFRRGDCVCFPARALGWWAARTVIEKDRGRMYFARFTTSAGRDDDHHEHVEAIEPLPHDNDNAEAEELTVGLVVELAA